MPTALQTPIRRDDAAQQVGPKRWRKQVLPFGKVTHEGKELEFSKAYAEKLRDSFNAGAYDQVPFQLADPENRHNADPEKFRGAVEGLEVGSDGLYSVLNLSDEGAKLIEANPKLGVSCRIVQDHAKGPAIQHVLGTLDPVCTGMKPWEKLDLAKPTAGESLIDLSGEDFAVASDGSHSSSTMSKDALTAEEVAALRKRLGKDAGPEGDDDKALEAAIAKLFADDKEPEPVVASLSKEQSDAIELATKQAADATKKADALADDLAAEKWKGQKRDLLLAGVPPSLVNLAEPHLSKASTVIELSNSASQASAMLKMLEEAKGTIDLAERGGADALDADDESEAKRLAAEWHESATGEKAEAKA
jgi:hypothetical protein